MKIVATVKRNEKRENIIFENGKLSEINLWLEALLETPEPLGARIIPKSGNH